MQFLFLFLFFHLPSHSVWRLLKLFGWLLHPETMPQHSRSGITNVTWSVPHFLACQKHMTENIKGWFEEASFYARLYYMCLTVGESRNKKCSKKTSVDRHMGCMKFNETVPLTRMWSTDFSLDTGMFHAVSKI